MLYCKLMPWMNHGNIKLCVIRAVIMQIFIILLISFLGATAKDAGTYEVDCSKLRMGQYICPHPEVIDTYIDPKTQQPRGCTSQNKAEVLCKAADGLICTKTNNNTFTREIPCRWTNGYHFETAMLLSIFLGMFGADRFYLGYPAIGLLKFCTMGFMFLGQLVDIILIATQVVGPADGSYYIIAYYGAGIEMIRRDNWTYRVPQDDW